MEDVRRQDLQDGVLVATIVGLVSLTYLAGLGFYSDDWSFLARLHGVRHEGFWSLFEAILADNMHARPPQALDLAVLFRLFGQDPLGYHVVNTGVLAAAAALFYGVLRSARVGRVPALAVAVVFGTLPHYSTDRFWTAAFQAHLAMVALVLSLLADGRFMRAGGVSRWVWRAAGVGFLLVSVLAYEITGPLFVLGPLVLWYRASPRGTAPAGRPFADVAILIVSNVVALGLAAVYKATVSDRASLTAISPGRAVETVLEAGALAFGAFGLGIAGTATRALGLHFDAVILAGSLLVGVATWALLTWRVARGAAPEPFPEWRAWSGLIGMGMVAFVAGYAVALVAADIRPALTGANNRTAIAAAPGVALVLVGLLGVIAGLARTARVRWHVFSALTAALVFSASLIVGTVGSFWVDASRAQHEMIDTLKRVLPRPPPGATVLLDGFCSYRGPAVVFETRWDVTGMLRLTYGDSTLTGDVVRANTTVDGSDVRTMHYVAYRHALSGDLLVVDLSTSNVHALRTVADAERYLARRAGPACGGERAGVGTPIF